MRITQALTGRVVRSAMTDGEKLVILCQDGTEAVISWREGEGPVLEKVNANVHIAPAIMAT